MSRKANKLRTSYKPPVTANKQAQAQEVVNIIRRETSTKEKWFDLIESSVLRIQPRLDLYLQAVELSLDKRVQNRNLLYDFYFNTLIVDDVVYSLIDKRLDNISNKSIYLVDSNNEVIEDYKYFFEAPKFRRFLRDIVMSKFWGFQLFGFKKYNWEGKDWFDYVSINHKHVDPYNQHITKTQFDSTPVLDFAEHPEFLFVGDADDLGMMAKVTKLSIMLRQGDFWYGKYADLASENFTQIQKKGLVDEKTLQKINQQMQRRSGGAMLETDDNLNLKFHNQSSSQQNQLY
ncbi:MAG: phage portal protein family protein, partial [bacterium]